MEAADLSREALQAALYGADPTQRVVAVETADAVATVLIRQKDDTLVAQTLPFTPWLLLREPRALPQATFDTLDGDPSGYHIRARFPTWRAYQEARRVLRDEHRDTLQYGSAVKQFLIDSGCTLFKGMAFPDIVRMQIDIETTALSWNGPDARIFLIACSDNRGREEILFGDETEMLERLTGLVRAWDPDVLEGHNLYAFDLPWIRARAKARGVALTWGRDGSEIALGQERNAAIGANSRPFVPHYVWGRHILDTLLQTQRFDVARGEISRYGLKECAVHYHIAEPDREILDRSVIAQTWREDPERVRAYALADVRETRRLAEIVAPTEFYQVQMVPDSFQSVAVTGSGEKINSLFVRAYLHAGAAIARQQPSQPYPGGYTEMRRAGRIPHIVKADVESLYPSIMLTRGVASSSDTLGLMLPLLRDLTRRRLAAKKKAKEFEHSDDLRRAAYWDGLQGSYKLLINSFYGYLGAPFPLNDYAAAQTVTEMGQEIVKAIADELERRGSLVVEIDTDGVYFQPPAGVDGPDAEEAFVASVGETLPPGIRLAFDGRYAHMLSLKAKNYVLVAYDGKKTFKGSSLRSRADERFGRRFLDEAVDLLLAEDRAGLAARYQELLGQIERRELGIEQIARRERVTEKTFSSEAKRRNREAVGDLKVGDYATLYQREDRALAPADAYAGDEDVEHYQTKLHKFAERLRAAVGDDFDTLFPRPLTGAKRKAAEDARQQMALFDL